MEKIKENYFWNFLNKKIYNCRIFERNKFSNQSLFTAHLRKSLTRGITQVDQSIIANIRLFSPQNFIVTQTINQNSQR